MNNDIVSILTDHGIGGTFLTWSVHYLSGHEKYFLAKKNKWMSLCDNPLNDSNAHNFKTNQPFDKNSFDSTIDQLVNTATPDFHTIYFHNFNHQTESYHSDLKDSIDQLYAVSSKMIRLTVNKKHHLYHTKYNLRDFGFKWTDPLKKSTTSEEAWDDFIKYFFNQDLERWHQLDLKDIWDRREFLALNLKPKKTLSINPNINLKHPHYSIDSFELYNTFDQTVEHLFDFLELNIDQHRKIHWTNVFYQWRQIHTQSMLFVWYFDEIIDSIINNHYLDLTRFNLDIIQESTIQGHLIYNHNLNLKTWQLDKFKNTQQLHSLLEPNTHIIK